MMLVRYFAWLVPVALFGVLAIFTRVSPWLCGALAALVILIGYFVGWLLRRRARARAQARR